MKELDSKKFTVQLDTDASKVAKISIAPIFKKDGKETYGNILVTYNVKTGKSEVPSTTQCNDGTDNDGNGCSDYPNDPGCTSASDTTEIGGTCPPSTTQCNDGTDNDGNGCSDYPNDPGCTSASDTTEIGGTCLTGDLIAYYPFEGNANDESGNGNNGVVSGAVLTTDKNGNANSAYLFDGTGDSIECPNSLLLSPDQITISVWVNPTEILEQDRYIIFRSNNYFIDAMRGWGGANKPHFYMYDAAAASVSASSSVSLIAAQWNHLVGTYDGSTMRMYLNNNLVGSAVLIPPLNHPVSNLIIGAYTTVPSSTAGFNGIIDEVRIYNRALSSTEVANLYTAG